MQMNYAVWYRLDEIRPVGASYRIAMESYWFIKDALLLESPGPRCIKLTINGNFAFNGNYHGNKTL